MEIKFGTDGVRGDYGDSITDEMARDLGYHATKVLTKENKKPKIIVGTDTRESGENLKKALIEGIVQAGGTVQDAGIVPTPAVSVLVRELGADSGVVISASHNPYQSNGIKFFNSEGYKLPDAVEERIAQKCNEALEHIKSVPVTSQNLDNAEEIYLDFLNKNAKSLKGKKIVLDLANGANFKIAPDFFKSLGAEVITIGDKPNGKNINLNCGSTHLDLLQKKVVEEGADFGFAFDGDADRCLAVDNKGNIIDGDLILYLFAMDLKKKGKLKGNTVVVTEMSNTGLIEAFDKEGINSFRTDVGDRYVLEKMKADDFVLGGEQSGHIIVLDKNTTGDGLLTASLLAEIFNNTDGDVSSLVEGFFTYPQNIYNVTVDESKKSELYDDEVIMEEYEALQSGKDGIIRANLRPSGTEPYIRVMLEGHDWDTVNRLSEEFGNIIKERLCD